MRVALPKEHGGYLTLVGAAVAGVLLSPSPLAAVGVALALTAAFFSRGPLEKRARSTTADVVLLATCVLALIAGTSLTARASHGAAAAVFITAGFLVGVSSLARRARAQRSAGFELLAMGLLGGAAGRIAFIGGASLSVALPLAIMLSVHAGSSVLLVRTELRPQERARAARVDQILAAVLIVTAVVMISLGTPKVALALSPRVTHIVARRLALRMPLRPVWVGLRETLALTIAVLIAVLALR